MAKIIIVDDDDEFVVQVARTLGAAGHTCVRERSGQGVIESIEQQGIDLLILDVMLPGVSGFELCRRIRAQEYFYRLPILFLTAMDAEEEVSHGLAQGADDYMTKPFRQDLLLRRVDGLLQQGQQNLLVDKLTSMAGPKAMKLELQNALGAKRPFAVAYIELVPITEFVRQAGEEARLKAIRHLARAIKICGEQCSPDFLREGHMGGGHFVCMLETPQAETFGRSLQEVWKNHMPHLLELLGKDTGSGLPKLNVPISQLPQLDLAICIMNSAICPHNWRDLLTALSQLRQNSVTRGPGLYLDRRRVAI